jgi:hypothetical protein
MGKYSRFVNSMCNFCHAGVNGHFIHHCGSDHNEEQCKLVNICSGRGFSWSIIRTKDKFEKEELDSIKKVYLIALINGIINEDGSLKPGV